MRYSFFYKLINISMWDSKFDLPYTDVVFKPTIESAKLLAKLNLVAVCNAGSISIYYNEKSESFPKESEGRFISFDESILNFSFVTSDTRILNKLNETVLNNPIDKRKWIYKINEKGGIDKQYIFPIAFTNYIFAKPNEEIFFSILKNGNALPKNNRVSVRGDEEGRYACTGDLSNYEGGEYELLAEGFDDFFAYIDTHNELSGKTGFLQIGLHGYSYTTYSSSSPPAAEATQLIIRF